MTEQEQGGGQIMSEGRGEDEWGGIVRGESEEERGGR